nr:UTRA domain-containing protein [Marinobacterium arenosum]
MTELYGHKYDIHYGWVRFRVPPTALVGDAAEALNVGQGSQGLLVIRINYDQQGRLIDSDFEYWRHNAICISADIAG